MGLELAIAYQPALISLDIHLTDMNGFVLLSEIMRCKETRLFPVVALTATTMEKDIKKALEQGIKQYITKPIDIEKLNSVIDHYLITIDDKL